MQSDGFKSALSPVVYGHIALSINTHYITWLDLKMRVWFREILLI